MSHQRIETISDRIQRLVNLAGSDEGFYVLALNSFIEWYMLDAYPQLRTYDEKFRDVLYSFRDMLAQELSQTTGCPQGFSRLFNDIWGERKLANAVRHEFSPLDKDEALAATHRFLRFCSCVGVPPCDELDGLKKSLDVWNDKTSILDRSKALISVKFKLLMANRENKDLSTQVEMFSTKEKSLENVSARIDLLETELESARTQVSRKDERIDDLRKERFDLISERKKLTAEMESYSHVDEYLSYLSRFSLYTRSRLDYEKSLTKLTPEQQHAVDAIDSGADFLVKGAAGTGKTLVLLEALRKIREETDSELDLSINRKIVLCTYTTTLVKFDRYIAEVMDLVDTENEIVTADSYILKKLKFFYSNYYVDYKASREYCSRFNTADFLSNDELESEIEDLIFGNYISEEEYIDHRIARRGMRTPLNNVQRQSVWNIRSQIVEEMEQTGRLSKNYSRIKLLEAIEKEGSENSANADFIFIDETQDLSAVDLRVLKALSSRALIMAGDSDQSIYCISSPYKRAGIEIVGRTRILHTNFRNTLPVHDLAEMYRISSVGIDFDETSAPVAFRDGPIPELYRAPQKTSLFDLVIQRTHLYIERLEYDPENICILAPSNNDLDKLKGLLNRAGFKAENIRAANYSFKEQGLIKLSTLHSSKGLDFPVVLLLLPSLPGVGNYDDEALDRLYRNLIYVAMTRAMDNLNIFLMNDPKEPALTVLGEVYEEFVAQQIAEAPTTN
ncbi:MAG: AAA family ATPase [Spirochaetales bacterium]|jgi:superfamily I DNA/RNA helicase|nr:AAA family ATPase [Spirochaetales bacterium]